MNGNAPLPDRAGIRRLRWAEPAKSIVAEWRALTSSSNTRRTVVACSGGADSVALLVALASAEPQDLVVCHVQHELRSECESAADAEYVERIAASLGLPFELRQAGPPAGNAEAHGRARRYELLRSVAVDHGCAAVVTGHHADDQCETFLMAALRGSGTAGLSGIARDRPLCDRVRLLRPMLHVTHEKAIGLCKEAGISWREDATNADADRTRSALRQRVLPVLREIRPDASERVSGAASRCASAEMCIADAASKAMAGRSAWARDELRQLSPVVLASGLRSAARVFLHGHADALTSKLVAPVVDRIGSDVTEPAEFDWPGGLAVIVTAREVRMIARPSEHGDG